MPLVPGDRLGPYEIAELIGKGGMGEVYRAHDPRLRRDVAIKVSARQFSERFEREARAVAALNHPNICTLYDVGPNYLVMELVEGPTLAERIKEGVLSLEEALPIAHQITSALEAAHDKGITHRDLKPGNVKIRPGGLVKLLDFGLAKVAPAPGPTGEDSPTISMLSMAATEAGVVLGTAAYMSPEQARGKANLDKRSDIWAFGVVFHEMLTREKLFRREDIAGTLAAILKDQPDLNRAPFQVRRLIARCLEKDPSKRLRDIGDVWDLEEGGLESARAFRPVPRWPWILAAVTTALAITFATLWLKAPPPDLQPVAYSIVDPPGSRFTNTAGAVALSPDGRYVVFGAIAPGGLAGLWLRPLDSLEARLLPGTERGNYPIWSPDSKSLAFFSNSEGKVKRTEIAGGAPVVLGEGVVSPVSTSGTWNNDGVILHGGPDGHRVRASGGGSGLITRVDTGRQETGHGYPQFLPDGKRFLYFVASDNRDVRGVYAASLDQPEQRTLVLRTSNKAVYVPARGRAPGYLLWMQDQTLLAQRFDPDSLALSGDPVSVAQGVSVNVSAPVRAAYWADGGALAYYSDDSGTRRAVLWKSADGKTLSEAVPVDSISTIRLSPDGKALAMSRGANSEIWLWEFARGGAFTRLTFDTSADSMPVWSPDGRQIAWVSFRDGIGQIYRKDASGAGQEQRLTEGPNLKIPLDWSRDGKYLLYSERNPKTAYDLWVLPLEGDRKPNLIAATPGLDYLGQFSPDGKWIVYASSESGQKEVYVQPAPGAFSGGSGTGRWQISNGGGDDPKWGADGREIYFEAAGGRIMAAAVRTVGGGFRTDAPRELFNAGHDVNESHSFDVTANGEKFIVLMPGEESKSGPLNVITNWQSKLR